MDTGVVQNSRRSDRLIHPLIVGALRNDPSRILKTGLLVAIETGVLLAKIGVSRAMPANHGQALMTHWLAGLLGFVFWVSFALVVLVKHIDVVERNRDFGMLRIFGASGAYFAGFLLQETVLESIAGILLGLILGSISCAVFEVLLGVSGASLLPWWPVAMAAAILTSFAGALSAIPRAIREGVAQAL